MDNTVSDNLRKLWDGKRSPIELTEVHTDILENYSRNLK